MESPLDRLDASHESCTELIVTEVVSASVTLLDEPLYQAVTGPVTFDVTVKVTRLKSPVVDPAGTDTPRGIPSPGNETFKLIKAPPEGAELESVTVHVLLAFELSVDGSHCNDVMIVGPVKLMVTLCEAPPYDAVIDPFWFPVSDPVRMPNDPVLSFGATVTDPGSVSPDNPLLLNFTTAPLEPTGFDRVTVQLPLVFDPNVARLHRSELITADVAKVIFAVCLMPPYATVIVPFWSALKSPALTVNDPVVAFAGTQTDAGVVRTFVGKLVSMVAIAPPEGAGPDSVTVQLLLLSGPSVAGVHWREKTFGPEPSVRVVLCDDPL